jgi:hypothetical protein
MMMCETIQYTESGSRSEAGIRSWKIESVQVHAPGSSFWSYREWL